jgi:hypothetical protein
LGQICYLAQIRLGLGFACLGVKSPLYIYRGRASGVRHGVFSKGLASLLYSCLGGVTWSVAPSRRRGSGPRSMVHQLSIQSQCLAILPVHGSRPVTLDVVGLEYLI